MRIGIVGDIHHYFSHPMYRRFCYDTFCEWRCDRIHLIGDIVDAHALSFHEHDPNGRSAEDEFSLAVQEIDRWHRTFPGATVSIGNHDERHFRTARRAGIPDRYLRTYQDLFNTPTWQWDYFHEFDKVGYEHGTGNSGKYAAFNLAIMRRKSMVIGHLHSDGGVMLHTNPDSRIFGLGVGCGIDIKAYAFAYGKNAPRRPTLGCGVVLDGESGHFIPMRCSRGEPYHRSRAGKVPSRVRKYPPKKRKARK